MTQSLPLEVRFLKRYSRALHQAGVPAHQLEGLIQATARWMGYKCDFWSSPTAIFLSLRNRDDDDEQPLPMQLVRLHPGAINLAATAELYDLGEDLVEGRLTLEEANQRLKEEVGTALYSPSLQVLAGALVVLLKLALGVLVGKVIAGWFGWTDSGSLQWAMALPPDWFQWPALLLCGLAFAVLFNVRYRDMYLAVFAAVTGYAVSRAGVIMGGVEFGILLAALVVGLLGNLLGRWLRRPASLVRVPGIILLVPGALGYRAVTHALLDTNANPQETVLLASILVIALVGGLLIGNTIVPPRRFL